MPFEVSEFMPDWRQRMTAAQAEEQLHNFQFKGPGWYTYAGDTLLVVPDGQFEYPPRLESNVWEARWPDTQVFWFMVYAKRNPSVAFNAIANAPSRATL